MSSELSLGSRILGYIVGGVSVITSMVLLVYLFWGQ